jgi:hypothetical protein
MAVSDVQLTPAKGMLSALQLLLLLAAALVLAPPAAALSWQGRLLLASPHVSAAAAACCLPSAPCCRLLLAAGACPTMQPRACRLVAWPPAAERRHSELRETSNMRAGRRCALLSLGIWIRCSACLKHNSMMPQLHACPFGRRQGMPLQRRRMACMASPSTSYKQQVGL